VGGSLSPTAVRIRSFAGSRAGRAAVGLRWRTGTEVGVAGFHVWRHGQRLTTRLIVARGVTAGAGYRYLDRTARPGRTYVYRLEVIGLDGRRSWFGATRVKLRR